MAVDFELNAELRSDQGKGASRRLRRADKVPGVLYGARKEAQAITLDHNDLLKNLGFESFYSHILNINLDGTSQQAILKDVQRHPAKNQILHIDLLRVSANEAIRVHVPLHFLNESTAVGVKQQGGVISHHVIEVEVSCLPKHLPEYLEIDIAAMEIGDALHLSDIKLPEGIELIELSHGEDHDQTVVSIHHPRVTAEEEPAEEAESAEVPTVEEEKEAEEGNKEDEKK
ncbi:MAG TPA: 50S ribosomal protein L25/general stress protein Ctc [Gammaproteobacteria bacterium]|nr:50S ribosomal protein L25/general stress protein Ctc [Gammaproteobacteria bacterium]